MHLALQIALYVLAALVGGFLLSYVVVNVALFVKFFMKVPSKKLRKNALKDEYYDGLREEMLAASERMDNMPNTRITCTSKDGLKLSARHYENESDKLIVFFHGAHAVAWNGLAFVAETFLQRKYNVLIVDQRAHGQSEGRFFTYGCRESDDVLCWLDRLADTNLSEIILYGISMGATALGLASDRIKDDRVKALIMDCGFTSLYDLETHILNYNHIPGFLMSGLIVAGNTIFRINNKECTQEHIKNSNIPMLFLHGTADRVVPIECSKNNFDACKAMKEMITVDGAGHTTATVVGGEEVRDKICDFINKAYKTKEENSNE